MNIEKSGDLVIGSSGDLKLARGWVLDNDDPMTRWSDHPIFLTR
jgi:hypothetical protein